MATTASEPTVMSRIGGFFNGVGLAFRDGWRNVTNGDFRKMDWKQGIAMGITGMIIAYAVMSLAEMIWEKIKDFMPYIITAVALLAGLFLLSKYFGGDKAQQHAELRPDPARGDPLKKTSMLDGHDAIAPEVKKLVMREVDSTQLAMLDPDVAANLNLNAVRLSDDLPKAADERDVTRSARESLAMIG